MSPVFEGRGDNAHQPEKLSSAELNYNELLQPEVLEEYRKVKSTTAAIQINSSEWFTTHYQDAQLGSFNSCGSPVPNNSLWKQYKVW